MAKNIELKVTGIIFDEVELMALKEAEPEKFNEMLLQMSDKAFNEIDMRRTDDFMGKNI